MVVDERIGKFASDTLVSIWKALRVDTSQVLRFICSENDCSDEIQSLVLIRFLLFKQKIRHDLEEDYPLYSNCHIDFYLFLRTHVRRYLPYPGMNIFDKLLMLCAVVATMGLVFKDYDRNVYRFLGPRSLARYFETEWIEEFYEAGGWKQLKKYAEACFDLRSTEIEQMLNSTGSDLKNAEMIYDILEKHSRMDKILETFKQRANPDRRTAPPCCSKCFPLYDVLHSLSYPSNVRVDDIQLIEGYLQIFMRMVNRSKILEILNKFMIQFRTDHDCPDIKLEDMIEDGRPMLENAVTLLLRDNIFKSEKCGSSEEARGDHDSSEEARADHDSSEEARGDHDSSETAHGDHDSSETAHGDHDTSETAHGDHDSSETAHGDHDTSEAARGDHDTSEAAHGDQDSEICIFCGENKNKRSVAYLTSIIIRTVSEVWFSSKIDSDKKSDEANSEQASRKIEKFKSLRLFLALGTDHHLNKVNANIVKESDIQKSDQKI